MRSVLFVYFFNHRRLTLWKFSHSLIIYIYKYCSHELRSPALCNSFLRYYQCLVSHIEINFHYRIYKTTSDCVLYTYFNIYITKCNIYAENVRLFLFN